MKNEISAPKIEELGEILDESLLEYNLSLTYERRLENHQQALNLVNELLKVRKELYGEFERPPEAVT